MSRLNLLQLVIGVTLVMLFFVGCGFPATTPVSGPLPPLTKLYLCGSLSSRGRLQEKPCSGYLATEYLWDTGDVSRRSFDYELKGDIPGGLYEIALDLAAAAGNEGEFEVSIALVHGKTSSILAQTVITATSTDFQHFTMSVVGIDPDAQAGDQLVLTVRNLSDHLNKFRFGDLKSGQGYLKVPW